MARIGIIGSEGRMGQALAAAIAATEHALAGGIGRGGDVAALAAASDVLLDFSSPAATEANLAAAVGAGVPILVGTTGLTDAHQAAIDAAAQHIAVIRTGNTSLGVAMLGVLVREAAARLGEDWDIEVLEMHHRAKVDAPSGTAIMLGRAAAQGRGRKFEDVERMSRPSGPREPGTIGFASLRGGTVAGDHSVIFAGNEERITLSHNAENRSIFAKGAVKAGAWLVGKPAGRYTMPQVLGL
jgi:4-hydroxy-tetrahydrodipicolinate reductase